MSHLRPAGKCDHARIRFKDPRGPAEANIHFLSDNAAEIFSSLTCGSPVLLSVVAVLGGNGPLLLILFALREEDGLMDGWISNSLDGCWTVWLWKLRGRKAVIWARESTWLSELLLDGVGLRPRSQYGTGKGLCQAVSSFRRWTILESLWAIWGALL